MNKNKLKVFSGRSNLEIAEKTASTLNRDLGKISIRTFSDGEIWVKYEENIRGCDVFIIQSTNGPSENIMELALLVDAAVRASADTRNGCHALLWIWASRQKRSTKSSNLI